MRFPQNSKRDLTAKALKRKKIRAWKAKGLNGKREEGFKRKSAKPQKRKSEKTEMILQTQRRVKS
ncbi:MAG: hypothetical protein JST90_01250 [Bacteroidetes bacterium]|nr:hypothetical protein [Bacteroidota bacterium]